MAGMKKKDDDCRLAEKAGLGTILPDDAAGGGWPFSRNINNTKMRLCVLLLTADDMGYPQEGPEEPRPRPAQNVIFELDFNGPAGANLVCALYEEGLICPRNSKRVFDPHDEGECGGWLPRVENGPCGCGFEQGD
jgi:hypothetical protein